MIGKGRLGCKVYQSLPVAMLCCGLEAGHTNMATLPDTVRKPHGLDDLPPQAMDLTPLVHINTSSFFLYSLMNSCKICMDQVQ